MQSSYDGAELTKRLIEKPQTASGLILEAWSQGAMFFSLIIMSAITISNMRKGVLLHKLILIELCMGCLHGTFIFFNQPIYAWWLSCTAIFLNASWSLHNVIAWLKTKPFLSRNWSLFYIGTVILAQPYWVLEIYANFAYFHNINDLFLSTRPAEPALRDPWWIFTILNLFYNIRKRYEVSIIEIVRSSPRFGVLLTAMCLSIVFIVLDILAVTGVFSSTLPDGLNPFWKIAFVFKCLTDTVILDDFKTALDKLTAFRMSKLGVEANPLASDVHEDPYGDDAIDRQKNSRVDSTFSANDVAAQHVDTVDMAERGRLPNANELKSYDDVDLPGFETELASTSGEGSSTSKKGA